MVNNTSLAIIQPDELETIQRTGRMLAASGYFDAKGESAQSIAMMATKILAGREIGIGPFAAVNGIHIIKGKPSIGANILAAAVKTSSRYDYRIRELTDKKCKIEFFQRVGDKLESLGIVEFTAEDALKAGTQNMDKFPKNMLFARCISNGVRFHMPDVFNGNAVYVPEELGAEVDGEGNVIDTTYTVTKPFPPEQDFGMGKPTSQDAPQLSQTSQDAREGDNGHDDTLWEPEESAAVKKTNLLSQAQLKRLNIVGSDLYGKEWDDQRPKLVQAVSKGTVTSSKELTPGEATVLIRGMEKKLQEVAAMKAAAAQSIASGEAA